MNDVTVLPKKKFSPVPITSGLGPERAILERIVQNQKWFTHKNCLNLELELYMLCFFVDYYNLISPAPAQSSPHSESPPHPMLRNSPLLIATPLLDIVIVLMIIIVF